MLYLTNASMLMTVSMPCLRGAPGQQQRVADERARRAVVDRDDVVPGDSSISTLDRICWKQRKCSVASGNSSRACLQRRVGDDHRAHLGELDEQDVLWRTRRDARQSEAGAAFGPTSVSRKQSGMPIQKSTARITSGFKVGPLPKVSGQYTDYLTLTRSALGRI